MFKALLVLMQRGNELSNAETWRNRAAAITALSAFLSAALVIARACGLHLEVSDVDIEAIARGVVALALVGSAFLHVAADKNVGVQRKRETDDEARTDPPDPGGGA